MLPMILSALGQKMGGSHPLGGALGAMVGQNMEQGNLGKGIQQGIMSFVGTHMMNSNANPTNTSAAQSAISQLGAKPSILARMAGGGPMPSGSASRGLGGVPAEAMPPGGLASIVPAPVQEGPPPDDKQIINAAVDAIKGSSPDPQSALAAFLKKYGENALRDLVDKVHSGDFDANAQASGGLQTGAGDGMQDMIPAKVQGGQDVLLSDGEYVVPADVVSGLGNGSTSAGTKHLDGMLDRVRELRHGTTKQPGAVPAHKMMPKGASA